MLDNRPEADCILAARLIGTAKRHARWQDLTDAEHAAAVDELRELAAGRGDLLAELASSVYRVGEGGSVLDPLVVSQLVNRPRPGSSPAGSGTCSR